MATREISAVFLPSGQYRGDIDTAPGVGRDGRAITAAIAPENTRAADFMYETAGAIRDAFVARLYKNSSDPTGTRKDAVRAGTPKPTDTVTAAVTNISGNPSLRTGAIIIGALVVIGVGVFLWNR